MKSTLLIIKESLKKRKKQYIFLSLTLFLTTLLLTVAMNLLQVSARPFDDNFEKLKASHLLLFFDAEAESYQQIANWYQQQPEVLEVSKPVPYMLFDEGFIHDGKQIKVTAHLTEYIYHEEQDNLTILHPDAMDAPRYNEVWLPYHFSANYGLEVGDTLQFRFVSGSFDFVISSFVVDPHFLSGLLNPTRIFMAPGAMAIFQPLENLSNMMVGIRMHEPRHAGSVYSKFLSEVDFSGTKLEYQLFKSAFNGIFSLFSAVLMILSIMIFAIALLVLNGTLSGQIFADYKQIGIMKALGFTPAGIRNTYLLKLSLLSIVAIPLGIVVAYFSILLIIGYMNSSSGLNYQPNSLFLSHIFPGFIIAGLTLLVTLLTTSKAGKISAVQAIQKGTMMGSNTKSPVSYRRLSSEIIMGLQFIVGRPVSCLILCFSFAVFSFMILFVFGVGTSLEQVKSHKPDWGFVDADLQISLDKGVFMPLDKSDFLNLFSAFEWQVNNVIPYSFANLKIISGVEIMEVRGRIYDIDLKETGFQNLSGAHPNQAEDIALCIGTARMAHVEVGDSIIVMIEGSQLQMHVCSIYQDISAFGQGFRLHASAMESVNPLYETDQFGVKLMDVSKIEQIQREISSFFGEKVSVEKSLEQRGAFLSIISNLRGGILLIAVFFIVIISIMVANDLNIHINRDKGIIAKLKAIGFTDFQVKYSFLFKNTVIMLTGNLLGVLLAILVGKSLISGLTGGMGLPNFPFEVSFFLIAFTLIIIILFGYLSSWNAMRVISKIKSTQFKSE